MRQTRVRVAAVAAVLGLGLVGGCSGGSAKSSSAGGFAQASAAASPVAGSGGSAAAREPAVAATAASVNRAVIVSASVSLRTPKVDDAANRINALATRDGGRVDGDDRASSGAHRTATLILRVPPAQLEAVLAAIDRLGTETSRTLGRDDVTASKADVDARVSALATSVTRLQHLLSTAGSVRTLLQVENVLTSRQGQLDSLRAQQRALTDQIVLATVTVNVSARVPAPAPVQHHFHATAFGAAFGSSIHGLGVAAQVLIAGLGYLLPELLLLALLAAALVAVRRRRGRAAPPVVDRPTAS